MRAFTRRRLSTGDALQAVRPLEEVDSTLRELGFALVLISLGGIALAVWLGRLVARAALTPVKQLTETTEHVARTRDLSRRIRADGTDELSRLGASFNTMLEALAEAERSQRQLVADASHELRTPLTSLRTNIEVLAGGMLPQQDHERLLRDLVVQLDELTVLVADLVDLARGDESDPGVEDVRLDTLVEDAVERARRHASDKVFFTELEPCLVAGVPGRLDRAVTNLLDNAAKWSPNGGQIEVRVRDGEVSVRDHGPGIDGVRPSIRVRPLLPRTGRKGPAGLGTRPRDRASGCGVPRRGGGRRTCQRGRGEDEPEAARDGFKDYRAGMRLAIISDTHMGPGRRYRLPDRCEELIAASDLLVHAGDVMTLEALAEIEAIGPPVRAVAGNMDGWDLRERLPDTDEIDVEGATAGRCARCRAGRRTAGADAAPLPPRGRGRVRPLPHPVARARGWPSDLQSRQPDRAAAGALAFDGRGARGERADRVGAGGAVNLRSAPGSPGFPTDSSAQIAEWSLNPSSRTWWRTRTRSGAAAVTRGHGRGGIRTALATSHDRSRRA